jgi:hypothetical protein
VPESPQAGKKDRQDLEQRFVARPRRDGALSLQTAIPDQPPESKWLNTLEINSPALATPGTEGQRFPCLHSLGKCGGQEGQREWAAWSKGINRRLFAHAAGFEFFS